MKREEMAQLAQKIADGAVLPEPGCRVAVVVTDEEGMFVGVGSNTSVEDTRLLLFFAGQGQDPIVHEKPSIDVEAEVVTDGK